MNSKSQEIALVGPFPPLRGGISLFNSELKKAFEKSGHEVLTISFKRQYPGLLFPGSSELMPEKKMVEKLEASQIIDTCNPLTWLKANEVILKSGVDAAVISWWHPWFIPCFGFIADRLKKAGVRVCFLCHNFRHHGASITFWDFFIKRMLLKSDVLIFLSSSVANTAARSFARPAARFFPRSFARSAAGLCKETGPPCVTLFHPVYNTEHIKKVQIPGEWKKRILMAGYVRGYKGVEYGLNLLLKDKEIVLTIAGEFYDKKLLASVMEKKRLFGNRLKVIPQYLTDLDLVKIIDDHDILICPYTLASQSGVVALAQGRATPVAAFPAGGLADQIFENTGVVCEKMSSKSLKKAIDEIYIRTPLEWADSIRKEQLQNSWTLLSEQINLSLKSAGLK